LSSEHIKSNLYYNILIIVIWYSISNNFKQFSKLDSDSELSKSGLKVLGVSFLGIWGAFSSTKYFFHSWVFEVLFPHPLGTFKCFFLNKVLWVSLLGILVAFSSSG